jgi:hypothetical protein
VDRETFEEILEKVAPHIIHRDEQKATNSSGTPIPIKTWLAVTLHWLAGASHLDLCFAWGIAHSTFFSERGILWPTIEALDDAFDLGFPIDDIAHLQELSKGFFEHSGGILDGCVCALDGFAVRTPCPYKSEVRHQKDYRFRKGGFAFIVLAGCDIDAQFIVCSAKHCGSTNDIIAWGNTKLQKALEVDRRLPQEYFFIGDEAFTNTQQFLSPWPGRGLDRYKDSFNFWLSHSRQVIEHAFGLLTQSFKIFWRRFHFSLDRWSLVVLICMKLHNLCLDRNLSVPLQRFMKMYGTEMSIVQPPHAAASSRA